MPSNAKSSSIFNYLTATVQSDQAKHMLTTGLKGAAATGGILAAWEVLRYRKLILTVGVAAAATAWVSDYYKRHAERKGYVQARPDMGTPSFRGDADSAATQQPQDMIDEAMMESFPASDPPASYRRA
jgi:hypothetical protein